MTDTVLLTIDGPRATVTLNNPAKHNRLDNDDIRALMGHLDTVETATDVRVLVLTGAGEKTFCAGFDLGTLRARGAEQPKEGAAKEPQGKSGFELLCDRVEALRVPTIGAFNGGVYGGGTDLAMSCDFRVGIKGMRAFVPPARLGLHYYPGGMRRFIERVGPGVAKRFYLLAEEFDGEELLRVGYVDWLVERAEFKTHVDRLAATVADGAPLALQAMKIALNQISANQLDEAAVRARMRVCAQSEDLREGLAALAAKRKPVFKGR
jgi:enoyl-CoA hydratase/carnithine racemase